MQLELPFRERTQADLEDIARLAAYLYSRGSEWTTAKIIGEDLGIRERRVRELAAESGGLLVSGPGAPGYKHCRHCTPDEIREVTARLLGQAKLMAARASEIARQFHRTAPAVTFPTPCNPPEAPLQDCAGGEKNIQLSCQPPPSGGVPVNISPGTLCPAQAP